MNEIPICKMTGCIKPVKKDKAYPKRWTLFCSRECANKHTRNSCTEKIKETCTLKYGANNYLASKVGKDYLKKHYQKEYGVDNPSQAQEVKDIKKSKSIEKYGVDNPSQAQEVKDKIQRVRRPYKEHDYILPSGKIIKLQGYENHGMDILLEKYTEDEILTKNAVPKFEYIWKGKRTYYPDFYIPKDNLIVEIKSTWTIKAQHERNLLKSKAVIANGFKFQFMVFDAKGTLIPYITPS